MQIHRLEAEAAGAGEPVEDKAQATEETARQPVHPRLHLDARILVKPRRGFNIEHLAGGEHLLEDVAIAVQPNDAVAALADEAIDEEAGPAEQEIGRSPDALEGVVDGLGRGEELVLPHVYLAPVVQVER